MKRQDIHSLLRNHGRGLQALMAAAVLTAATACAERQESAPADLGGQPIVLTLSSADGGATRGNTGAGHKLQGDSWCAGDRFSVRFLSGSTVESAVYKVGATGTGTQTATADMTVPGNRQPYFKPGSTEARLTACFPAQVPEVPTTWTVAADQHSGSASLASDAYTTSDLCYAEGTVTTADATALTFSHRMAHLTVKMYGDDAAHRTFVVKDARLVGGAFRTVDIADAATLTPGTQLSTPVTTAAPLRIWYNTSDEDYPISTGWIASCVLPPQRICQQASPVTLLRITTAAGGTIDFQMQASTLEAGHTYNIELHNLSDDNVGKTYVLGSFDHAGTVRFDAAAQYTTATAQMSAIYQVGDVTFRMQRVKAGDSGNGNSYGGRDFWMGETEVTSALWQRTMGATGGDDYPARQMTRVQIYQFLKALNEATATQRPAGYRFVLPKADMWLYAARGGIHHSGKTSAGSSDVNQVGWVNSNSGNAVHKVAQLLPNELGLYDMTGNVFEFAAQMTDNASTANWVCGGSFSTNYPALSSSPVVANPYPKTYADWGLRVALVKLEVGDLYFSDGTWGTKAEFPSKTPIGIVFCTDNSETDMARYGFGYGYAVALYMSNNAQTFWYWAQGTYHDAQVTDRLVTFDTSDPSTARAVMNDMDGLTHCKTAYANNGGMWDNGDSKLNAMRIAAQYGSTFQPNAAAPTAQNTSSGWYLPGIGQLYHWVKHMTTTWSLHDAAFAGDYNTEYWEMEVGNRIGMKSYRMDIINAYNQALANAGLTVIGVNNNTWGTYNAQGWAQGRYWYASTEYSGTHAWHLNMYSGRPGINFFITGSTGAGKNLGDVYVYSVLAF